MTLHDELYAVFAGKTSWKVEGLIPVTDALDESTISEDFCGPIGAIILAGGRGSRLGVMGPKGCVEVLGKSLFEHLLEKAKRVDLFIAIMTSPDNHDETKTFLEANSWFGLDPERIDLFIQSVAPTFSKEGTFLYNNDGTHYTTPSGNGAVYGAFRDQGILSKWKSLGIKGVNILMIDNFLGNPADPKCISLIGKSDVDLVIKTVERNSFEEKVGLLGVKGGRLFVQEYFELSLEERENSKWKFCNTGMFSCSIGFLEEAANINLPWHLVQKGSHFQFETFIFDAFYIANKFLIVRYPRKISFAPIKSFDDIEKLIPN